MEEEVSAVDEVSKGAGDFLLGAATVAVTGAVDEVTPLTRTKEVFLQTRDLPRATDWVMVSLVSELRRGLSFLAIKRKFPFSFPFYFSNTFFIFLFFGELWRKTFSPVLFNCAIDERYPAYRLA